ncbi:MAG: cysteine desulfurase [Thermomicrobiales bacterium]|nr:cysteine desulfurase [Thermomicrobiales bacterium]
MESADDTIYLDHAATTPVAPAVLDAMLPYFGERFGNPSSIYQLGQDGRVALDRARAAVARILACQPAEILFTSGATESDNQALSGVAWHRRLQGPTSPPPHIVTTSIEHHAVLHTADWLERQGFSVTRVPADEHGFVDRDDVARAIRPETCLVSVMYANNEIGSIQPLAEISRITRDRGIPFHTDAVQAAGTLPLNVDDLGVDLLSLSAHKFYGPKGVGLLYVRRGTGIAYQQHGGGQESGRRGGTENVPGIVGMAVALERADSSRADYHRHCSSLRDRLFAGLSEAIPDLELNGPTDWTRRLPNNLNVAIRGVQGETALLSLDMQGIAASAGSACTTGNSQPSHVLQALGYGDERCRASLRLTLGWSNTADQIDETIDVLADTAARIRQLSGVA